MAWREAPACRSERVHGELAQALPRLGDNALGRDKLRRRQIPLDKGGVRARQICLCGRFHTPVGLENVRGGYLDTDVQILRPIENVLDAPFVSGIENHGYGTDDLDGVTEDGFVRSTGQLYTRFCLQAGFMYAEPGHPFVDYCLEHFYGGGDRQFVNDDGSDNAFVIDLALMVALRKGWGMAYRDRTQLLPGGIKIYDSSVFATRKSRTDGSYLIHWFDQSWRTNGGLSLKLRKLVKKHLYFLYRKL